MNSIRIADSELERQTLWPIPIDTDVTTVTPRKKSLYITWNRINGGRRSRCKWNILIEIRIHG